MEDAAARTEKLSYVVQGKNNSMFVQINPTNWLAQWSKISLLVPEVWGSISGPAKSDTYLILKLIA